MITEKVGKMIIRRSPKSDSVCDIILMDIKNTEGYKASLNTEQTREVRDLLNKYIREAELLNL